MKNSFLYIIIGFFLFWVSSCVKDPQPIKVTGITLNSASLSLVEGETFDLVATISPKDADNQTVIWSSSNGSVASVSNGKVIALKAGLTEIVAKSDDGGFTAKCAVTVAPKTIEVSSISLSKTELSLTEGDSETITASVKPDNVTDNTVTWISSDVSVATVKDGVITAIKVGAATITASAGGKTATCSVTVTQSGGSGEYGGHEAVHLGLSVKWATCNVGASSPEGTGDFYAWGETEPKSNYSWTTYQLCNGSSTSLTKYNTKTDYGTVDNKTQLELSGDAARATLGGNWRMPTEADWTELRDNCTWTWTTQNGVNGYRVASKKNSNSIFLPAAGFRSESTLGGAGGGGNYWSSTLYTNKPSTAYYVRFNQSDVGWYCTDRYYGLSVRPVYGEIVEVSSISLDKSSASLNVGESLTLTAIIKPSNASNKSVTWSSSNTSVATVSSIGVVTAKAAGTATITVTTSDGGKTATCSVTVQAKTVSVTGVSLNKSSLSMTVGDTQTLTATVSPSNATNKSVTWSSSNTSVATVSSSGVVTAEAAGTATITVTTSDGGKKATCSVTVQAKTVSVTGVSLNKSSLSMTVGDTQTLTATVSPSNATNKSVTWSSSNTSVATVSSSGVVTAKAAGSATITVTTSDGGKKATCSVTVTQSGGLEGHEAVDLGLSVKWATCNVGASAPEEYGDFFSWGETEPKKEYDWGDYQWCRVRLKMNGRMGTTRIVYITKYGTVDNKTQLELSDDAARANWGGNWRMPTIEEWIELLDNCTWTWITVDYKPVGHKVTSKKNGNSIFLPIAGFFDDAITDQGTYGYYWSSTLSDNQFYADCLRLQFNWVYGSNKHRNIGCSVRPVTE